MRRTARQPARFVVGLAVVWLLALSALVIVEPSPKSDTPEGKTILLIGGLLLAVVLIALTLHLVVTRATMDDRTLELRAVRAKNRLVAPLDEVIAYRKDKLGASWWVDTSEREVQVAVNEPWELHRAFLDFAPTKLGGKRMRFPGVPPLEDFRGLWTYDVEELVRRSKTTIVVALLLVAIFRRGNFAMIGQLLGLFIAPAIEAWGRIDVTREGIVRRGPFHRREILWKDARAIFREGSPRKRSFVIVGRDAAIEIPAHLAIDRDLMEKVLYSLPDPILCVNFDETTLRGYRRRKKAKEKAAQEDLLPALTA